MNQRRRHSALEALVSTAFGFLVSIAIWPPVSVHVLHKPAELHEGFAVVGLFTLVSIARGYLVRRVFNYYQARHPIVPTCIVCRRPAVTKTPGGLWCCPYHGGRAPRD